MGIDVRIGSNEYPDLFYYYSYDAVQNNKLVADTKPLGRISAKGVIDFGWRPLLINGNITSNFEYAGTIETKSPCDDLRPNMFMLDRKSGVLFIVLAIPMEMGEDNSEQISTRPVTIKHIELRGLNK